MSVALLNYPSLIFASNVNKKRDTHRRNSNVSSSSMNVSSLPLQVDEAKNSAKISNRNPTQRRAKQPNTVGIIGGSSVFSTLIFLEKLVYWSTRNGEESIPYILCSDPTLKSGNGSDLTRKVVEKLRRKRAFLEKGGARCIVMPSHDLHVFYQEMGQGSKSKLIHVGECVCKEIEEAGLKPIEVGGNVRIGLVATEATLRAGFYQEYLQLPGYEVVLPDTATMEHIVNPALNTKDIEGARNLMRIAIQTLLVRAVNLVILAADDIQRLLPINDPLLKKCIDPMDALARSAVRWARSTRTVNLKSG